MFVRPDTLLPIGECESQADYDYPHGVTLRAYSIRDGARVHLTIPSQTGGSGSTFELHRAGDVVTVVAHEAGDGWRLLFVGEAVEPVSDCTVESTAEGSLVLPTSSGASIVVTLQRSH